MRLILSYFIFTTLVAGCSFNQSAIGNSSSSTPASTSTSASVSSSGSISAALENPSLENSAKLADAKHKASSQRQTQTFGGSSSLAFGVDYWPQATTINGTVYQQSQALYPEAWPTVRPQVLKDLDKMSALGVTTVRLMFWPNYSGFAMSPFGGWDYASGLEFQGLQTNLQDMLGLLQQHRMTAVIAFANRYILDYVCANGSSPYASNCAQYPMQTWWQWGYGGAWWDTSNYWQGPEFPRFLAASNQWMSGIIGASESSAGSSVVTYYDYFNEYAQQPSAVGDPLIALYQNWYIKYVFQWVSAPAGKRGISFLHTYISVPSIQDGLDADADSFIAQVGAGAVQHVDFHPYATPYWSWDTANLPAYQNDIAVNNWILQQKFPGAQIVMGEFGLSSNATSIGEQNRWDTAALAAAKNSGIQLAMNWGLWEDSDGVGIGTGPDSPKDVYGVIADSMAGYKNLDMETVLNGSPDQWSAATNSSGAFQFLDNAASSGFGGSATGTHYARLQLSPGSAGGVWMVHSSIPVQGAATAYFDFYFRSSMSNVQASVIQFDANGNQVGNALTGPTCTSSDWAWHSYVQDCGGTSFAISPGAVSAVIAVSAVNPFTSSANQYLDVDTVSISLR